MGQVNLDVLDSVITELVDAWREFSKKSGDSELRHGYASLRVLFSKLFSYKLVYGVRLKEEKRKEEDAFGAKTQSWIVKGYAQNEREVMRRIGSSEEVKKITELLDLIETILDGCRAIERTMYGSMQASQLDLKLSGLGH